MKIFSQTAKWLVLPIAILSLSNQAARALSYSIDNSDVMLCFRGLSGGGNPDDLEVDIGPVGNYLALPIGGSTNLMVSFYSASQLTAAFGRSTYENIRFSAFATESDNTFSYPYPLFSTWLTYGRSDPATQTVPFGRGNNSSMSSLATSKIQTVGVNASFYSGNTAVGPGNTATAIEIPFANSACYEKTIVSGNFSSASPVNVENTSPNPFTNAIVSDFYIDVPLTKADAFDGNATTGSASLVGYFTFQPDGSVTFTRAVPRPTLSIVQSGNQNTISFVAASTAKYTFSYTNVAGLTAPLSTWPTNSTVITGDSTVHSFIDVTTDPSRFYSVTAH
jgi:hypothetical protein